jgi:Tol biopolymer transport system component
VGEDLYQPQLWVIRPTGTGARKIAEGQAHGPLSPPNYNLDGVWSHDGSMVHVMKGCDSRLSNIAVHSWVETPVVNMGNKAAEFVWSPDDTKVAYFNYTNVQAVICMQGTIPTTHDLMVMNADGSARTVVLHNTDWYPYSWPGASSVLLRDNPVWALMSIPGGAVTSLGISGWPAALSPDGASVAYISSGHVWVRAVTGGPVSDYGPGKDFAWSPDGESIAVTGTTLRVVTVATAASTTLYAHSTSLPTWSPDSTRVAFVKDHTDIYVQSITAANPKLVASGNEYIGDMQWQP